jgi:hypothetical protein
MVGRFGLLAGDPAAPGDRDPAFVRGKTASRCRRKVHQIALQMAELGAAAGPARPPADWRAVQDRRGADGSYLRETAQRFAWTRRLRGTTLERRSQLAIQLMRQSAENKYSKEQHPATDAQPWDPQRRFDRISGVERCTPECANCGWASAESRARRRDRRGPSRSWSCGVGSASIAAANRANRGPLHARSTSGSPTRSLNRCATRDPPSAITPSNL